MNDLLSVIKLPIENSFLSLVNIEKNDNLALSNISLPTYDFDINIIEIKKSEYNKKQFYLVDENYIIEKPILLSIAIELQKTLKEKISQEIECLFGIKTINLDRKIHQYSSKYKKIKLFFIKKILTKRKIKNLENQKQEIISRKKRFLEEIIKINFTFI